MREGEDEVLGEGVDHAEGERAVLVLAIDRVFGEISQGVVHPAHVPFEAEAQPAQVGGTRHARPARRFLGRGQDAGMLEMAELVQPLEEVDRLEVFVAAELVGDPFAGLARIVEVEHRGDGVDPQAVEVVGVEPEEGVAEEEVPHLRPPVVEDLGAPIAVLAQPGVGVLVEMGAVEVPQPVRIVGKVGGHPVEDDAKAVPVQRVDEVGEISRACRTARWGRNSRPADSPSFRRRDAR